MGKYKVLALNTEHWRPNGDYLTQITKKVEGKLADGDFIVISEKAISTALGNIVDESDVKPGLTAKLIVNFWMRIVWGYLLGLICHLKEDLRRNLREYPIEAGSRHKQVALQYVGLLQALMFGSEGGIDGSNLAYSYVSLPLKDVEKIAREVREKIKLELQKKVIIVISDTDKTYSFRNFHFTPRPKPIKGIHSCGGFISYVFGRMFKLKRRATPIVVVGCELPVEYALDIAEITNRARGFGAGRTVWEMAKRFGVELTDVSWEMLETVKHKPIVIVRSKR